MAIRSQGMAVAMRSAARGEAPPVPVPPGGVATEDDPRETVSSAVLRLAPTDAIALWVTLVGLIELLPPRPVGLARGHWLVLAAFVTLAFAVYGTWVAAFHRMEPARPELTMWDVLRPLRNKWDVLFVPGVATWLAMAMSPLPWRFSFSEPIVGYIVAALFLAGVTMVDRSDRIRWSRPAPTPV
jgi:hypothetical protein